MKNAKKYGGTLLMKNKILALVLAGTMCSDKMYMLQSL